MKQMFFLAITSLMGIAGSFTISPLWGIAVYYMYAVLRPQFIWEWVEAMGMNISDIPWSFGVAVSTMLATALWRFGLLFPLGALKEPWYGHPRYTRSHYLLIFFIIWISISYFTAIKPKVAEQFFIEYVKIFAMFICATQILRSVRDLWVIYFVVLGSAVYAAYEINLYYFSDNFMLLLQRGYGGLDNNGGALVVAMAVPMAYFAWEASRRWYRWGFLLVIPPLVHALMLSFSRGGMVALGATAIPVWLFSRHKLFLLCVYGVLGTFVVATAGKELQDRFLSISKDEVDESAQSRLTTWKIAIRMANERPFFGFGIRNSNLFTYEYGADIEGRSIHSQYLQTAADSGWVALGLYLGMFISTFLGLWSVMRFLRKYRDPESEGVRAMAAGVGCALFLFCVGAVFLSLEHFEMPYIILLLAMQVHAITNSVAARLNAATTPNAQVVVVQAQPNPPAAVAR
jgi:probable O-glycosylation ligase (exosortase A-associated)